MLNKRQAMIREGIENAERARRDLAEATARAEQLLEARRQAQETIAQAAKAAERKPTVSRKRRMPALTDEQQQIERIRQEAARARAESVAWWSTSRSVPQVKSLVNRSIATTTAAWWKSSLVLARQRKSNA